MFAYAIKAFSIFGAGFMASLSPCVYPMIPITVGYFGSQESRNRNFKLLTFILGQVLALTALAIFAVKTGRSFGFSSQSVGVNLFMGLLLLLGGVFSLKGRLPGFLEKINQKNSLSKTNRKGYFGAFILGVGTSLLASPCTTPILSGIMVLLIESNTLFQGVFLMFLYSVGFSLLILLIAFGVLNIKSLPKNGTWMTRVHQISAFLLVALGLYYLYNAYSLYVTL